MLHEQGDQQALGSTLIDRTVRERIVLVGVIFDGHDELEVDESLDELSRLIDTAGADEVGLDLVEIAPEANPPVCKIMDFGKYKYEVAQKAREARQNQTHIVVKEVRLTPKIETHDYVTKRNQVEKFLKGGDKVKVTMKFRGREQTRPEMGYKLLQRLAEDVAEFAFVEFAPKQEGRNMTMVLGPTKKKTEAVAEAKAARKAKADAAAETTDGA